MTTGKTIALTRQTSVSKVMSLLFNMLSRLVHSFPGGSEGKVSACNAGDPGSIPGLGRSPGEGNANPLQYLAWEIAWTVQAGGLYSHKRVRCDLVTKQQTNGLLRPCIINIPSKTYKGMRNS